MTGERTNESSLTLAMSLQTIDRLYPPRPHVPRTDSSNTQADDAAAASGDDDDTRPPSSEDQETCAICLNELTVGTSVRVMHPCRHTFHASQECIDSWIRKHAVDAVSDRPNNHIKLVFAPCPACRCEQKRTLPLPDTVPYGKAAILEYLATRYGLNFSFLRFELAGEPEVVGSANSRTIHVRRTTDEWIERILVQQQLQQELQLQAASAAAGHGHNHSSPSPMASNSTLLSVSPPDNIERLPSPSPSSRSASPALSFTGNVNTTGSPRPGHKKKRSLFEKIANAFTGGGNHHNHAPSPSPPPLSSSSSLAQSSTGQYRDSMGREVEVDADGRVWVHGEHGMS